VIRFIGKQVTRNEGDDEEKEEVKEETK